MIKDVDKMNNEEKEELLKNIIDDLKKNLSNERYLHSISTMQKAKELAKEYDIDELTVMLTSVAHDIAKEMTNEEYLLYAKENNIELDEIDKMEIRILHGKIGAHIVGKKYGFTQEMQEAICYHTTGRENMTLLDKIVFLADKSENRRESEDAEKLRKIIKKEGLDNAILWDIDYYTIPRMIKKQKMIHPNSIYARNDIISKINVN